MNSKAAEYAVSLEELGRIVGVKGGMAGKYLARFRISKTKQGYPIAQFLAAYNESKRREVVGDGSLKEQKLQREIKLLDIEIDERMKRLITVDAHLADITEIAAWVKAETNQWLQWIASELRDAQVYDRAKLIRARLLARLEEKSDGQSNAPSVAAGDKA